MAKKFEALAEFRQAQATTALEETSKSQTEQGVDPTRREAAKGAGRPTGKRSNPDYEPTTVLLRKQTKRKASRLLEDTESENDLSDLIEMLLGNWISATT